jgi:hypothetical protein
MKNKINTLILLAVGIVPFGVSRSAKGVPLTYQQFRSVILKDGPGPMCPPHTGCGYRSDVVANQPGLSRRILLTDGTGPMCPPTSGCGNGSVTTSKDIQVRIEVLLADGTGPMCPPRTGCGQNHNVTSARNFPAVVLPKMAEGQSAFRAQVYGLKEETSTELSAG